MIHGGEPQLLRHGVVAPEGLVPREVELPRAPHHVLGEVVLAGHLGGLAHERPVRTHALEGLLQLVAIRKPGRRAVEGAYHATLVHLADEVVLVQKMVVERLPAHARLLEQALDGYSFERHALLLHELEQRIYNEALHVYCHLRHPFAVCRALHAL